jgi:chemotaxis protein histidine kinase CheA
MSDDPISGLHRRFDTLESNFDKVRKEQHEMSKSLVNVNHRIDLVEMQIESAHKREALIVGSINEKLEANSNLVKKLFDKFDRHDAQEAAERKERIEKESEAKELVASESKKLMWWIVTTCVSVLVGIGMVMFNKVFQ